MPENKNKAKNNFSQLKKLLEVQEMLARRVRGARSSSLYNNNNNNMYNSSRRNRKTAFFTKGMYRVIYGRSGFYIVLGKDRKGNLIKKTIQGPFAFKNIGYRIVPYRRASR
jgi:predicted ribosome quality control (RQC) complex YloA/Tae2 family protein